MIDDLERVYDGGNIDRFRSPIDGSTIARSFRASEEDVAAARGVTVRVTSSDRQRTARVTLSNFGFDWPLTGDVPASGTVDVFATVRAPIEGVYRFRLDGPPGARLDLNNGTLLQAGQEGTALLARGSQRLRILATVAGPARFELSWTPPGTNGLTPIPADHLFREQRSGQRTAGVLPPGRRPGRARRADAGRTAPSAYGQPATPATTVRRRLDRNARRAQVGRLSLRD